MEGGGEEGSNALEREKNIDELQWVSEGVEKPY